MAAFDWRALFGRKQLDAPAATQQEVWDSFGGASFSGISPRELIRQGYKLNSAVFACVSALVFGFREPSLVVRNAKDEPQSKHPLRQLIRRPNPLMGEDELMGFIAAYAAIGGNAYLYKLRSRGKIVTELWPYHAGDIKPVSVGNNWIDHYLYDAHDGKPAQRIDPADIIHIKWMPDPERPSTGLAPMIPVAREIDQENEMTRYLFSLLVNDAVPRTALKVKGQLDERSFRRLKAQFNQEFGGDARGSAVILDQGMEIDRLALDLNELAFDALRGVPEARITAAFRVPAIIAGLSIGLARSTFANYAEARKAFAEGTLVPLWSNVASEIERDLGDEFGIGDEYTVGFDLRKVAALAEGENDRWKRIGDATKGRILRVNEARAALGYDPVDGGDTFLTPAPAGFGGQQDGESDTASGSKSISRGEALRALKADSTATTQTKAEAAVQEYLAGQYQAAADAVRGS